MKSDPFLIDIRKRLAAKEDIYLDHHAEKSAAAVRRYPEALEGHRPPFAVDADRILHSRAYTRYIDKTQVFYMIKNDHITHRVLHVQLVSKIARTIGRVFSLNEDLIESIALGHDIGHPPFGHDGEKILHQLCVKYGLPSFQHNLQSVRFLEHFEKKGEGVNLTLQTLDGILCHDGEVHDRLIQPDRILSFADFDMKLAQKAQNPSLSLVPMTLEACVVRFADTISYIGRDIEDAIELKLIKRHEIPLNCQKILGKTNGTIVHNLVSDLIRHSQRGSICFSPEISEALLALKKFNYKKIYLNPRIKKNEEKIKTCYCVLFESYFDEITSIGKNSVFSDFIKRMNPDYLTQNHPAAIVCDFISGMTDDYFIKQARLLGCDVPRKQ